VLAEEHLRLAPSETAACKQIRKEQYPGERQPSSSRWWAEKAEASRCEPGNEPAARLRPSEMSEVQGAGKCACAHPINPRGSRSC
jgi:hypothetical protein